MLFTKTTEILFLCGTKPSCLFGERAIGFLHDCTVSEMKGIWVIFTISLEDVHLLNALDIYHLVFNPPSDPEVIPTDFRNGGISLHGCLTVSSYSFTYCYFVKVAKRVCEEEGGLEVNMRQTLLHYHQNSFAVLECYKRISKTFNADQPLQDLITQG